MKPTDALRRAQGLALNTLLVLICARPGAAQTPRECVLHPEFLYCQPTPAPSDQGLPPKPDRALSDERERGRRHFEAVVAAGHCAMFAFDQETGHPPAGPRPPTLEDCWAVIRSDVADADMRAEAYRVVGETALWQSRSADALWAFREWVRLAPADSGAHEALGRTLKELGRFEEALREYQEAVRLVGRASVRDEAERASVLSGLYDGIGMVLWRLDRDEEALTAFREATRLNPDDARTWGGLALTAFGLSRFGEAVTAWERALRIDPSYFDPREGERKLWETSLRAAREVQVTVIPFRPGRPIYVSARINGTGLMRLILDTGADLTLIAPRAFAITGAPLGRPAGTRPMRGVTRDSVTVVSLYEAESLQVGNAMVSPMVVGLHDIDDPNSAGLLGRDFLDHFTFTIDNAAGVVTLQPKSR